MGRVLGFWCVGVQPVMEPASSVSTQARSLAWLACMLAGGVPGLIGRLAGLAGGVPGGLGGLDRGLTGFLGFVP